MTPLAIALRVAHVLDALSVPYVLVGSMAAAAWGFPRTTNDADIVAGLQAHHIDPLVAALAAEFYVDRAAVERAVTHWRSFNAIHLETAFKVDIFVPPAGGFGRQQLARRTQTRIGPEPDADMLAVATAEDTVLAKLDWYRSAGSSSDRQWQDVVGVIKVQGHALDYAYLREWAERLGLAALLDRALSEAGYPG
jgi:hypothetical protein